MVVYGLAFLGGEACSLALGAELRTPLLLGVLLVYLAYNVVALAVNQVAEAANARQSIHEVLASNAGESCGLTPREEEVLACLLEGRSYESVGRVLFISSSTVKTHARHIYEKMGVSNRDEMIDKLMMR